MSVDTANRETAKARLVLYHMKEVEREYPNKTALEKKIQVVLRTDTFYSRWRITKIFKLYTKQFKNVGMTPEEIVELDSARLLMNAHK